MLSNLEIYRRATTGEICSEKDFDLKRFIPAVRRLVKEHGITYDRGTPVPSDDDLAERVWQAGKALFLEVGVFCVATERLIKFDGSRSQAGDPRHGAVRQGHSREEA